MQQPGNPVRVLKPSPAFHAKARLIRFLHEKMGFDVVAWESGLLDCRLADGALRTGASAREVAQRGIFPIWSAGKAIEPAFEYLSSGSHFDVVESNI